MPTARAVSARTHAAVRRQREEQSRLAREMARQADQANREAVELRQSLDAISADRDALRAQLDAVHPEAVALSACIDALQTMTMSGPSSRADRGVSSWNREPVPDQVTRVLVALGDRYGVTLHRVPSPEPEGTVLVEAPARLAPQLQHLVERGWV